IAQTRTCTNGILSGSFTNQTCTESQRLYLTSGTTWVVPNNWNSANNTIEVIGGGASGGGGNRSVGAGGGGAGGGGYTKVVNAVLTPGSTVAIKVGVGGAATGNTETDGNPGGDTYFCNSTSNCAGINGMSVVAGAKGGSAGRGGNNGSAGGAGGQASSGVCLAGLACTKFSGGTGGNGRIGGVGT